MRSFFRPIFLTLCPKEECSLRLSTDNAYRSAPGLGPLHNSADKPRATENSAGPPHHVCRLAQRPLWQARILESSYFELNDTIASMLTSNPRRLYARSERDRPSQQDPDTVMERQETSPN